MRRAIVLLVFAGLLSTAYIASPFVAAWRLREAIKSGDVATMQQKIEWASVRATLKQSLTQNPGVLPAGMIPGFDPNARPSLWQRVKTALGHSVIDNFVEAYITPQGLSQLVSYRKTWRETVKQVPDERLTLPWQQRVANVYRRLKRAEFQSLTRIEFEMADRESPERHYISVLELFGTEWKMTELRIRVLNAAERLVQLQPSRS